MLKLIKDIKDDPFFLCGMEFPEFKFNVYLTDTWTNKVEYNVFWNDELLFTGSDFAPSPLYNKNVMNSIIDLLAFLTVQPGDTDDEYFAGYTEKQLEWAKTHDCERLSGYVSDFGDEKSEYYEEALKFFEDSFTHQNL